MNPEPEELDQNFERFVQYASQLKGRERGEAQVFCERLFQALGHEGLVEIGATLEHSVRRRDGRSPGFADLLWGSRVLIEMKSRGKRLEEHVGQARDYWIELVPDRPAYVVLCNFDEFWIYDFNVQLEQPVDTVRIDELPRRWNALSFLLPTPARPLFANDRVAVTRSAADKLATLFVSLINRGETRADAQRFVLQCVVCLFSEDFDLLPRGFFARLLEDCLNEESSYDLIGGLFRQMANPSPARGGRYAEVDYFNGGLFVEVVPIELEAAEVRLLAEAANEDWRSVAPPIFGTLFQSSMDAARRHAIGAHFTHEVDIQRIVLPTIVRPWRRRIEATDSLGELEALGEELQGFRVLDPACGSGNFLYVAYREIASLHVAIQLRIVESFGARAAKRARSRMFTLPPLSNFLGMDIDPFAVELARVTLMIGRRIVLADLLESEHSAGSSLGLEFEQPLPLDNLEATVVQRDALLEPWPECDAIVGNPPFISKNKAQKELGAAYLARVRERHPDVPGRADLCVYWFRQAHDALADGQRAGLVGTNTIRQNYSREGGLDHIVDDGGTIIEAVTTQVWSGDATVHVSIANWIRGVANGPFNVFKQVGDRLDSPWQRDETVRISPTLGAGFDVSTAATLRINVDSDSTFQGQTHGHAGFLVEPEEREAMVATDPSLAEVLHPFMIARDLLTRVPPTASRHVIDFGDRDVAAASRHGACFEHVQREVLPTRERAAEEEHERNVALVANGSSGRGNRHHENFLSRWWQLSYRRAQLVERLSAMDRYIACSRVTKRPIFVFVSTDSRPNDALQVFTFDDDYSFGVLQSAPHWEWFVERSSTMKGDFRYTSNTVYDSFPWPQRPDRKDVRAVAEDARALRAYRQETVRTSGVSLRDQYRLLELPGTNPLKVAHARLDASVRKAYGFDQDRPVIEQLFELNQQVSVLETAGETAMGPGVPEGFDVGDDLRSTDCFGRLETES